MFVKVSRIQVGLMGQSPNSERVLKLLFEPIPENETFVRECRGTDSPNNGLDFITFRN